MSKLRRGPARSGPLHEANEVQQEKGPYDRRHEGPEDATGRDPEQTEHPATQKRPDDADHQVAQDAESATLHDLTREKSRKNSDNEEENQALGRHRALFSGGGMAAGSRQDESHRRFAWPGRTYCGRQLSPAH